MPVWPCLSQKHGFTPRLEYAVARSNPFGAVLLKILAVRLWACVYVPFGAYLGLYAEETWLYAPEAVYTSSFLPV